MIHQTELHNLDICGIMAGSRDEVYPHCPCDGCQGILIEAWERMTENGTVRPVVVVPPVYLTATIEIDINAAR